MDAAGDTERCYLTLECTLPGNASTEKNGFFFRKEVSGTVAVNSMNERKKAIINYWFLDQNWKLGDEERKCPK